MDHELRFHHPKNCAKPKFGNKKVVMETAQLIEQNFPLEKQTISVSKNLSVLALSSAGFSTHIHVKLLQKSHGNTFIYITAFR